MSKSTKGMPEVNLFSKLDKVVFMILGAVVVIAISWKLIDSKSSGSDVQSVNIEQPAGTGNTVSTTINPSAKITIVRRWDMPEELKEISALTYLDENRFACVQDELGTVFIYNIADKKVEKRISFAAAGDYEGLAFTGSSLYVVRADGQLFETPYPSTGTNNTKQHRTPLTVTHNIEGLCYDKEKNRLLLATKDEDPNDRGFKNIYSFDLQKKSLEDKPVFKIDLANEIFSQGKKKKVSPSAIAIHPQTKDIYITDGPQSRLLILDTAGTPKQFLELGKDFSQPEGISFDAEGKMYISNEGTKQPGNILQVDIAS